MFKNSLGFERKFIHVRNLTYVFAILLSFSLRILLKGDKCLIAAQR